MIDGHYLVLTPEFIEFLHHAGMSNKRIWLGNV